MPFVVADYGVTWDEPFHDAYARGAWARIGSWWSEPEVLVRWNYWVYGGWFDAVAIAAGRILPVEAFTVRHLCNALTGVAGIAGAAMLGRELAGPAAGFVSALLLVLSPFWFGHMFNNPKDIPFGAAFVWVVWAATRAATRPDRRGAADVLRVGALWGIALGARVAGGILLPAVAWSLRRRPKVLLTACGLAYVVMLAGWPYAMAHPVTGPWRAAREISRFTDAAHALVRFDGGWYRAAGIPRWYAPGYLAVTLPEPVLVGLVALAWWLVADRRRRAAAVVPALAVAVPLAVMIGGRTILYDGVRHLLFLMPPLCALAAAGLTGLSGRLPRRVRFAGVVLFVGWALIQTWTMAVLHPHEAVGYNRFTGGLRGAAGRWTLDVWGNAYREGIVTLRRRLESPAPRATSLIACPPQFSADRELPPWIRRVPDGRRADFHLSLTDRPCREIAGAPYVVVERFGVPLAEIHDLR